MEVMISGSDGSQSTTYVTFTLELPDTSTSTIEITPSSNLNYTIGDVVSLQVAATGTPAMPYTFTARGLPPGLSIDAQTGLITGSLTDWDLQEDDYIVTLSVIENGQIVKTQSFNLAVNDASLSIVAMPVSAVEGAAFAGTIATISGASAYTTPEQTLYAVIDWGDGETSYGDVVKDEFGVLSVAASHIYISSGEFIVDVTLYSMGGGEWTSQSTATISASQFSITGGISTTTVLNAPYDRVLGTFTDSNIYRSASDYNVNVTWSDGTENTGYLVDLGDGNYAIHVVGTHASVGVVTATIHVSHTMNDVTRSVTTTSTIDVGDAYVGQEVNIQTWASMSISEMPTSVIIHWGDGTTSEGMILDYNTEGVEVSGTHVYATAGVYYVFFEVFGNPTGSQLTTGPSLRIVDGAITLVSVTNDLPDSLYIPSQVLATFTSTDATATAEEFSAVISWGNGTTSNGIIEKVNGVFRIRGIFADLITQPLSIKLTLNSILVLNAIMLIELPIVEVPERKLIKPESLGWKDFQVYKKTDAPDKNYGAWTAAQWMNWSEYNTPVYDPDLKRPGNFFATLKITQVRIVAQFDKGNSWQKPFNKLPPLKHEQYHLKLSQYIAQLATDAYITNKEPMKWVSKSCIDKDEALKDVTLSLEKFLQSYIDKADALNQVVSLTYDRLTEGGSNAKQQKDWEENYQSHVTNIMKQIKFKW